jgi:signal transduction histidine kinase
MKITTRIVSGYGLFIAVLMSLTVYQIVTVIKLQTINRDLKDINFDNAYYSLEVIRRWDWVDEFTRKYLQTGDPDYIQKLNESIADFEVQFSDLRSGVKSGPELIEVERLKQYWDRFSRSLELIRQGLPAEGMEEMPSALQRNLELLEEQTHSVYSAIVKSIATELDRSAQTSQTAQIVLISITIVVLSVTILVSLLIVRSISKPLAHLTEGTRAITEGKYFYRLDTSRKDEFAQLAKDFNIMIRRLSELDELKKDFISHVSHELKAPLASMRETVQLLIDQIPGPLTPKQKRLLELNLQSGDRLTTIIRNLLDLSKFEAGTMEYELKLQDMVPLVGTSVAEFEVQAAERQVQIETSLPETPLQVRCDSDRIIQVIVNLVGNAVKFSSEGGSVRIRLETVSDIPETIPQDWRSRVAVPEPPVYYGLLSVADSCPGISDSDKTRIFEKFHQVKKGGKIAGQGVGLGLAICRTIVRAHHGAVWVEDNPGGGCRFFLLLSPGEEEAVTYRASHPI